MDRFRAILKFAGKRESKVVAVFGNRPECCARAVLHLRNGVPDIPIWLFATHEPLPETAALCQRVVVVRNSVALAFAAHRELWPHWVSLMLVTWTGESGLLSKVLPLTIPPFRILVMNAHGDFFNATPRAVGRHVARALRDRLDSAAHRFRDLSRGVSLWLFALVAQRSTSLSRFVFRRRRGHAPLVIDEPLATGEGVEIFRYAHRKWNWQELHRLVRTSTCRHILFLEGDAQPGQFPDLHAFAISRQTAFRGCNERIFPMAPFRTLQAGEVSQTLAPVSDAILVDRAKLAALGVPKTIVPGTAWLLLFWKAAAAGWRSYSVGGGAGLREIADWPYEEAEFVTRVLSDRTLGALGPREPDLARGSVAFVPRLAQRPRGQCRVLVVSPYLPYPLSHGGAVRIYNLCRALAGQVDFVLASFREKGERIEYDKLHEVFREVYVVDRDEKVARVAGVPRQVREHASRSMRALIAEICRTQPVDLLQIEFTHLAHFRDAAPEVPAILVEHDLTFTLYRQFAEQRPTRRNRLEYQRWVDFERHWLRRYEGVWVMSEQDRELAVAEGACAETTCAVANGVDVGRFQPVAEPDSAREVFYVGSFRHKPNVIGFEKLRTEVMPRVWARFPDAHLRVVAGPDFEKYWSGASDSRITVHGFTEDLRPLYAQAAVVVIPLFVSAGTNIKVMEAMACGKAVVSTPIGCQGLDLIDGHDAVIRGDFAKFAESVCELLADPGRRRAIGARGRATVEARFGWDAIAARAWECYEQVVRSRGAATG